MWKTFCKKKGKKWQDVTKVFTFDDIFEIVIIRKSELHFKLRKKEFRLR